MFFKRMGLFKTIMMMMNKMDSNNFYPNLDVGLRNLQIDLILNQGIIINEIYRYRWDGADRSNEFEKKYI
jgi:hypothetical protein